MAKDWRDDAACAGHDIEMWYPSVVYTEDEDEKPRRETHRVYREARRICDGCPVREACLEHALTKPELFGMWGGKTRPERATLARARRHAA